MDMQDSLLSLYGGIKQMVEDDPSNLPWKEWIFDSFAESPIMRTHIARRTKWYGPLSEALAVWKEERETSGCWSRRMTRSRTL